MMYAYIYIFLLNIYIYIHIYICSEFSFSDSSWIFVRLSSKYDAYVTCSYYPNLVFIIFYFYVFEIPLSILTPLF